MFVFARPYRIGPNPSFLNLDAYMGFSSWVRSHHRSTPPTHSLYASNLIPSLSRVHISHRQTIDETFFPWRVMSFISLWLVWYLLLCWSWSKDMIETTGKIMASWSYGTSTSDFDDLIIIWVQVGVQLELNPPSGFAVQVHLSFMVFFFFFLIYRL